MENIIDSIIFKLKEKYNSELNCKKEKADLFIYVNGQEETIKKITTSEIFFNSNIPAINLYDADIHSLAYINQVI